jgi:hypothetical protein
MLAYIYLAVWFVSGALLGCFMGRRKVQTRIALSIAIVYHVAFFLVGMWLQARLS